MTLFEMERICPVCKGTGKVWNDKMGTYVSCKKKEFHLPDPGREEVKVANDAPGTSVAAAEAMLPRSGTARYKVLEFIFQRGERGATDEEIMEGLHMSPNTARPRRNELMNDGWIEDSGKRRETAAHQDSIVWVLSGRAFHQSLIGEITL